jgi:L-ascorbate metabolism protein UlaG (beta-lactamase superfamily)
MYSGPTVHRPHLRVPPFLRCLLQPSACERDDRAAVDELSMLPQRAASELPTGLELQWLGTSGFRLSYSGHVLLIDPYVTRVPLNHLLRGHALQSSRAEVAAHVAAAHTILVGHTHFDHAMDVPLVAAQTGARVYGSRSLAHLLALHKLEAQAVEVEPYRVYSEGPFAITFVPSVHSRLLFGLAVPAAGELSCEHLDGLTPSAYRCGQVFGVHIEVAGVSFYHQGSADLIDDAIRHHGVDFFLAGIAGRGFTARYLERILSRLEPRVVVPHHYDNFFQPLSAPMRFSFNVNLAGFADEVRRVSRDFSVCTLPLLKIFSGGDLGPGAVGGENAQTG